VEAVVILKLQINYDGAIIKTTDRLSELQIIARESQYQFVGKSKLKHRDINVCENRTDVKRIEAWIE
jgi:hypothetical protein